MSELNCPLCLSRVYQSILTKSKVRDTDNFISSTWKFCKCGCCFNSEIHDPKDVFNAEYRKNYEDMKGVKERQNYFIYVYGNLIEELTYGRKFLDVGYCSPYNILEMRERGWLATGIDLIEDKDYHTGDFLTFDFGKERFDYIKMSDLLQCITDPLAVIKKAYDLLYPSGVLLISTPDTDLIRDNFFPNWGHWNAKENRQYVNESILREMLVKCNDVLDGRFVVKFVHRDISRRFISWNTLHLIAVKEKREPVVI